MAGKVRSIKAVSKRKPAGAAPVGKDMAELLEAEEKSRKAKAAGGDGKPDEKKPETKDEKIARLEKENLALRQNLQAMFGAAAKAKADMIRIVANLDQTVGL